MAEDKGKEIEGIGKGIPGVKPATKEQLPQELQYTLGEEDAKTKDQGLYGEFTDEDRKQVAEAAQQAGYNPLENVNTEALRYYQQLSRQDTFVIEMDDGPPEKYVRRAISQMQFDELEDLRAEIEGGEELITGKKLSVREIRMRRKMVADKKAEYYMIDPKTKKSMTPDRRRHARYADEINAILNMSLFRSLADAPEKNRLDPTEKHQ